MEINNFEKLVNAVTTNIIQKIEKNPDMKINTRSCLTIIPNLCLGVKDYLKKIKDSYQDYNLYFAYDESFSSLNDLKNLQNNGFLKYDFSDKTFIKFLDEVEKLVVVGLKIKEMKEISELDDSETISHIILSRLKANKSVEIMIDDENLIFNRISETINKLSQLGIGIITVKEKKNDVNQKMDLITERYVMDLYKSGVKNLVLNKKQLITPLAKDKLREYKINISYNEEVK